MLRLQKTHASGALRQQGPRNASVLSFIENGRLFSAGVGLSIPLGASARGGSLGGGRGRRSFARFASDGDGPSTSSDNLRESPKTTPDSRPRMVPLIGESRSIRKPGGEAQDGREVGSLNDPKISGGSGGGGGGGPSSEEQGPFGRLLALLGQLPATQGLKNLAVLIGSDPRVARLFRIGLALFAVCVFVLHREMTLANARVKPREVLYSSFVNMLDTGKVRAARLESGTSRIYFDVTPQEVAAAAAAISGTPTGGVEATATAGPRIPWYAEVDAVLKSAKKEQAKAALVLPAASSSSTAAPSSSASPLPSAAAVAAAPSVSSGSSSTSTTAAAAPSVGAPAYRMQRQYFIKLAERSDPLLINRILASGVEFAIVKASLQGVLSNIIISALAVWLPLMPIFFMARRLLEDRNSASKKKRSNGAETSTVTFADVAGVDSAKAELAEVVSVMKAARSSYTKLKVKMPSGVLLCGPPGTGKTLLAKAVAGEAGVPFMAVSASEFVEMYVGRGAARIRELFAEARKSAPCVVFIDELDAVGARRGMGYNDERDQTLNQLLTELDGFEGRSGVLFLAATNRIDVLDPALIRPGRLSRKVVVPLPDEPGRREILGVHLRGVPLFEEEDREDSVIRISRVTSGFSGAELANVVNEASLLAARKDQDHVSFRELLEGVQRTRFGVNGGGSGGLGGGLAGGGAGALNRWLMNLATAPYGGRKVKSAIA